MKWIAIDEYLRNNSIASNLKIFLPCTLEKYAEHYKKRADEGVITLEQAETLIGQLERVRKANLEAIIENPANAIIDKMSYFDRITKIVDAADELVAFQVNLSEGAQDTIDKARKKGIPVRVYSYTI